MTPRGPAEVARGDVVADRLAGAPALPAAPAGARTEGWFLHPVVDVLFIGGAVTFPLALLLSWGGRGAWASVPAQLTLLLNGAHFAASTVRLYGKPGALQRWPFLTMGAPLVSVVLLSAAIFFAESVGRHAQALYLTWSPFHYAAQVYGLSMVYGHRFAAGFRPLERTLIWWSAMVPFFWTLVAGIGFDAGLGWFLTPSVLAGLPLVREWHPVLARGIAVAALLAPVVVWASFRARGRRLPSMVLVLLWSNAIWWVAFTAMDAFVWSTILHSIQYLAIVIPFHVGEQVRREGNTRGPAFHAVAFYGACLVLAYGMFRVWPYAYEAFGLGYAEALVLTVAAINVHHFVVDGFIWRGGGPRRQPAPA